MFILGIMSLLQILFLPGYLFLGYFHFKRGLLQNLILSFGLSLSLNYLIVLLLTTAHIYNHTIICSIFVVELFLLIWQLRHFFHHPLLTQKHKVFPHLNAVIPLAVSWLKKEVKNLTAEKIVALVFIVCLINYYSQRQTPSEFIFSAWDTVFSWNRWAVEWYSSHFPTLTYEYPQLLPINLWEIQQYNYLQKIYALFFLLL